MSYFLCYINCERNECVLLGWYGFTLQQDCKIYMVTIQLYWWWKTSGALPCIISGTSIKRLMFLCTWCKFYDIHSFCLVLGVWMVIMFCVLGQVVIDLESSLWVWIPQGNLVSFMWESYTASLRNVGGSTWGLPPPVKLESRHVTFTVLVWLKTQQNKTLLKSIIVSSLYMKYWNYQLFT